MSTFDTADRAHRARRRRTATALAAGMLLAAAGVVGLAPSASAAPAVSTSATANEAAPDFTTPVFEMDCTIWTDGSAGAYYGHATCSGAGKWRVVVDCSWGFTQTSLWYVNGPGDTNTATAGPCWWGVNSVRIAEDPT